MRAATSSSSSPASRCSSPLVDVAHRARAREASRDPAESELGCRGRSGRRRARLTRVTRRCGSDARAGRRALGERRLDVDRVREGRHERQDLRERVRDIAPGQAALTGPILPRPTRATIRFYGTRRVRIIIAAAHSRPRGFRMLRPSFDGSSSRRQRAVRPGVDRARGRTGISAQRPRSAVWHETGCRTTRPRMQPGSLPWPTTSSSRIDSSRICSTGSTGDRGGRSHRIQSLQRGQPRGPGRLARQLERSFYSSLPCRRCAARRGCLLHGLTDSPYSLRSIGEHSRGRLRGGRAALPGHGTARRASSLRVETCRRRRMAMLDLGRKRPGPAIYLVGYSNGAALAVDYTLSALRGRGTAEAAGLVLISRHRNLTLAPSPSCARAVVRARLRAGGVAGHPDGVHPYSTTRFSFNAAGETHRLTSGIAARAGAGEGRNHRGLPQCSCSSRR